MTTPPYEPPPRVPLEPEPSELEALKAKPLAFAPPEPEAPRPTSVSDAKPIAPGFPNPSALPPRPKPPTIATPAMVTPFTPPTPDEGVAVEATTPPVAAPATGSVDGPVSAKTEAPARPATPSATAPPSPQSPSPQTSSGGTPRPSTGTNAISRPESSAVTYRHTTGDDATTLLAPVTAATNILDRIPLSERKRWHLISGIAAGLGVLFLGFAIYLWVINGQWQSRAGALTDEAYHLGERLADTRDQVLDQQAKIDLIAEQLDTSRDKVIELADEIAFAGDAAAYTEQRIAYAEELSALGGAVSLALNRCVNEQSKLVGYLKNPSVWDPDELVAFEASVNAMCAAAQSANATLQQELAK